MEEPQQPDVRVTRTDAIVLLGLCAIAPEDFKARPQVAVAELLGKARPTIHRHVTRLAKAGLISRAEGLRLHLPEAVVFHFHPEEMACTDRQKRTELAGSELISLLAPQILSNPTQLASCPHYILSLFSLKERESMCRSGGANTEVFAGQQSLEFFTRLPCSGRRERRAPDQKKKSRKKEKRSRVETSPKLDPKVLKNWPSSVGGRRKALGRIAALLVAGGFESLDAGIVASTLRSALRRGSTPQGLPDSYAEAVGWLLSRLGKGSRK